MIRFERDTLDDMKPAFLDWLADEWCECANSDCCDEIIERPYKRGDCCCYGRDEWDDMDAVIINDNGTIACHTSYGDNKDGVQHRFIILPAYHDLDADCPYREPNADGTVWRYGETFIVVGDMCWCGDDVDYYAPVLHYFLYLLNPDSSPFMLKPKEAD